MTTSSRERRDLVLYGGGGLGREVAMIVEAINRVEGPTWEVLGFLDDHLQPFDDHHGIPILGGLSTLETLGRSADEEIHLVVCIGNADIARDLPERIREVRPHAQFPNIVHPDATIDAEWNRAGDGNVIAAGARLSADAAIGSFNLVNMNAVLAHDVTLGDRCQVGPGALVNGGVTVGDEAVIGAGAVLMPRISVGAGATVALGAVAGTDVEAGTVVAGNPARVVKNAD